MLGGTAFSELPLYAFTECDGTVQIAETQLTAQNGAVEGVIHLYSAENATFKRKGSHVIEIVMNQVERKTINITKGYPVFDTSIISETFPLQIFSDQDVSFKGKKMPISQVFEALSAGGGKQGEVVWKCKTVIKKPLNLVPISELPMQNK